MKRGKNPWIIQKIEKEPILRVFAVLFVIVLISSYLQDFSELKSVDKKRVEDEVFYNSYIIVDESRKDSFQTMMKLNPALWWDLKFIRILPRKTYDEEMDDKVSLGGGTAGRYVDGGFYTYSENGDDYPATTMHEIGHFIYNKKLTKKERKEWDKKSKETREEFWEDNDYYAKNPQRRFCGIF